MPSFVLSLALLLLVLLMLLAVSNRELIALTFLGFSTVALPLSIWIVGAIALGFLLGLWILLLFRFGAVGLASGGPAPGRRRANYGPEDFAVVDDRFAEGGDRYEDGRYSDNRYDDVYGREQYGATASQARHQSYATERDYPAEGQSDRHGSDGYGSADAYGADRYGRTADDYGSSERQSYGEAAEPQDRFSAASGYEPAGTERPQDETQSRPRNDVGQTTLQQPRSAADPTIPADWDDQYREDWTPEELVAEPVLRNEANAPKLKRWFSQPGEGRPKLNLGGFGVGGVGEATPGDGSGGQSVEVGRSPAPAGEVTDWQGTDLGDRSGGSAYDQGSQARSEVYDADYRVVSQQGSIGFSPRSASEPAQRRQASTDQTEKEAKDGPSGSSRSDRSQSEWDIESDLDW